MKKLFFCSLVLLSSIHAGFNGIYFGISGGLNLGDLKKGSKIFQNNGYQIKGFVGLSKTLGDVLYGSVEVMADYNIFDAEKKDIHAEKAVNFGGGLRLGIIAGEWMLYGTAGYQTNNLQFKKGSDFIKGTDGITWKPYVGAGIEKDFSFIVLRAQFTYNTEVKLDNLKSTLKLEDDVNLDWNQMTLSLGIYFIL